MFSSSLEHVEGLSAVRFLSDRSHRDLVANVGLLVVHAETMIRGLDVDGESTTRRAGWQDYVSTAERILNDDVALPQRIGMAGLP